MTLRLVFTGPESTGKTTLATEFAARLGAPLLAEAARDYAQAPARLGRALTRADVEPIARLAIAREDEALAGTPPLLVLDTDLVSTVVYARHYYGSCPIWIEAEARARRGCLYLLCDIDLPWKADGVRDRPAQREMMLGLFRDTLAEFGCTVGPVTGIGATRVRAASAAVEKGGLVIPGTERA
ncbi:MAG TPA: ATP-binding protein [Gemmatimonadaceae bacterium]|nr:ATP-binding protein [Gemmatimonadaceae bacterium]